MEEVKSKSELHIGVSTLENLVKGGRIGRVTGLLSSLLNIRVIMELKDYQLNTIAKGRGAKTFTKWLDSYIDSIKDRKVGRDWYFLCRDILILHMKWLKNLRFWVLQFQSLRLVPSFKRTLVKVPLP